MPTPAGSSSRAVALLALLSCAACAGLHPTPRLPPPIARTALRAVTTMLTATGDAGAAPAPPARTSANLMLATVVACQGALQFGFAIGVLNIPQKIITAQLGVSADGIAWATVVSIWCLGGLIGAQTASAVADARGRKALLNLSAAINAAAGALCWVAGTLALGGSGGGALALLICSRLVSGIGCGMATVGTPLYLGEIATTNLRGLFGSLNQLSVVIGILFSQLLAACLPASIHWRSLLGFPLLLGLAQLSAARLTPESPRWSLLQRGPQAALAALRRLRPPGEAALASELTSLEAELPSATSRDPESTPETGAEPPKGGGPGAADSPPPLFQDKTLRLPLVVAAAMMVGQQWSGINAVFFYSTSFFAAAGLSNPVMGTLLASAVNALAMAATVPFMERLGRRKLLLLGSRGMLVSGIGLTLVLVLKAGAAAATPLLDLASVLCILAYVAAFELGPGPIPWQIGAEIFPEGPRAEAMGAAAALNWMCNAAIGLGFPPMQRMLGPYVFLPFCGVLFAWQAFTSRYVPETKGKSVAEVQEEFSRMMATSGAKAA